MGENQREIDNETREENPEETREDSRDNVQEEVREEVQKKKSVLENCLFWVAAAIWIVILGFGIYIVVTIISFRYEASKNFKKYSENFEKQVKTYYGLEKTDYEITDLDCGGFGGDFGDKPVYEFTIDGKTYYAAGTGEYLSTNLYAEEFQNLATAKVRETIDASGLFGDKDYQIENLTFVFKEMKGEVQDIRRNDEYTDRVKTAALLAVWVNRDELERFKTLNVDRGRWSKEINVYVTIRLNSEDAVVWGEEDFSAIREDLFYVEELKVLVGEETWVYRPKAGRLEAPVIDY